MSARARDTESASTPAPAHPNQRPVRVLRVHHETRYDYDEPVELAHHMAHLRPRVTPWQRIRDWSLRINPWPDAVVYDGPTPLDPLPAERRPGADPAGVVLDAEQAMPGFLHLEGPSLADPGADRAAGVQQSQDPGATGGRYFRIPGST